MATLNIMVGQEQGNVAVTVLRVEGDIDAATHKALQDKGSEVIDEGTTNILLDLSDVHYMGSAGFRAIHAISNMLERKMKRFSLSALPPVVSGPSRLAKAISALAKYFLVNANG